jgi:hypothetical protein
MNRWPEGLIFERCAGFRLSSSGPTSGAVDVLGESVGDAVGRPRGGEQVALPVAAACGAGAGAGQLLWRLHPSARASAPIGVARATSASRTPSRPRMAVSCRPGSAIEMVAGGRADPFQLITERIGLNASSTSSSRGNVEQFSDTSHHQKRACDQIHRDENSLATPRPWRNWPAPAPACLRCLELDVSGAASARLQEKCPSTTAGEELENAGQGLSRSPARSGAGAAPDSEGRPGPR